MNKTQNYQLNQWEKTDKVRMEDFNADNAKIDRALAEKAAQTDVRALQNALAAMPKIAAGTYAGTGAYGAASPNNLTFPFAPKMVVLTANDGSMMKNGTVVIAGQTASAGIGANYSSGSGLDLRITWSGQGLTWYADDAERQLNVAGTTYHYFTIG